ncbi:MAG: Hpt domain-containing protein, partial [Bdellovibrionales bacterium]|nr:Hpt domain-containing protein [Bdellovibrionales bacterium]
WTIFIRFLKPTTGTTILDLETLTTLEGQIGTASTVKVVNTFLDQLPDFIAELKSLTELKNLTALRHLGHKFKSSSFTVGASRLGELCRHVESVESIEAIVKYLEEIDLAINQTTLQLREYIAAK